MMLLSNRSKTSAVVATVALAIAAISQPVSAATLTLDNVQRVNTVPATPVNLTTAGSLDWAYWQTISSSVTPPMTPTNEKSGGSLIGNLNAFGGGNVRGPSVTTTLTTGRYSYADGVSPVSATNTALGGLVFNTNLGTSAVGKGISLNVAGSTAADTFVTLYLGGFSSTGQLTATLNGVVTPLTQTSAPYGATNPKEMEFVTLRFRPDSAADLLTVSYVTTAVTDTANGHVGIQAASVSTVPEPTSIGLAGVAGLLLLGKRSRRARA